MPTKNLQFPIGKFKKPTSITEEHITQWISVIEAFPERLNILTCNLTKEQLNWKYRPEGWSIKQAVHHCADSHMNSLIFTKAGKNGYSINSPSKQKRHAEQYKIWKDGSHAIDLTNENIDVWEKIHYIHTNPVKADIVD